MKYSTRQVLLIGNGINQAYGGISWPELLSKIRVRSDYHTEALKSPMPLQAILLTNNNIKDALRNNKEAFYGEIRSPEQEQVLLSLLDMDTDDILTTNYSYELEAAAIGEKTVSDYRLCRMNERTCDKTELRYLLHTYNRVPYKERSLRVWHIHGESRKPDSMILGHYWYGNQLSRIKAELDERKNRYAFRQNNGLEISYDSWIDSFILGDVYVLGFGFDTSEFDLWWLLNRKKREKAKKGKVFFYEPASEKSREKQDLLRLLDVEVMNLPFDHTIADLDKSKAYQEFYSESIQDIRNRITAKRSLLE